MMGNIKGNAACHTTNEKYREGWERIFGPKPGTVACGKRDSQGRMCIVPVQEGRTSITPDTSHKHKFVWISL